MAIIISVTMYKDVHVSKFICSCSLIIYLEVELSNHMIDVFIIFCENFKLFSFRLNYILIRILVIAKISHSFFWNFGPSPIILRNYSDSGLRIYFWQCSRNKMWSYVVPGIKTLCERQVLYMLYYYFSPIEIWFESKSFIIILK